MVNESAAFALSTLINVVGLVILLYGVKLTAGESLHSLMVVGGAVVLVAMALHTGALMRLDDVHGVE